MKTIMLVDDEPRMLDLLTIYLSPYYTCVKKQGGLDAISYLKEQKVDLVLLDVMMPEMDGWTTCREIRKISDVPIIMVTARNEKTDIVKGLEIGADDYVTKPFDEGELLARINAVSRRMLTDEQQKIVMHGLTIDEHAHECSFEGQHIALTPKEFALLVLFVKNPNKVFSRAHLLELAWGYDVYTEDRTIDSHVRNLRDKLRQVNFPIEDFLSTVWGVGYKWCTKKEPV